MKGRALARPAPQNGAGSTRDELAEGRSEFACCEASGGGLTVTVKVHDAVTPWMSVTVTVTGV